MSEQNAQFTQVEQPRATKKSLSLRTILLVIFVVLATLFAVKNWQPVRMWPFGFYPMTLVIGISFVLGALIGWLVHSLAFGRAPRRTL